MASDAALTQNDDYIVCDECDKPCIFGDCPDHGPLEWIDDCQVQQKTQARASLPSNLYLVPSAVGQGQMGVFAKTRIEKRVMFGPFKGQRIPAKEINFGEDPNFVHTWDVLEGGKVSHAIDGTNEQHSNWMRFVNCAHHDKEQNLVVMQYRGEIYYKTLVPVEEGSELLVWYKDSCVRTMDTSVESSSQKDQRGHDFVCDVCGLVFAGPNFLLRHKSVRCPGISETSDRADEAESLEKETSVDAGSTVPSLEENESSYVIVHIGPNANENNITRIEAEKDLPYVVVHVEPAPSSDKAGNVKRGKRTLVDEKKINSSKKPKLANVRQRSADSARKAKKVVSKGRLTKARRTAQSKVANARVTATKKSLPSKKTPLGTKRKTTSTSSGSKPSKSRRGTVEKVNKKRTGQNKSAASSKSTGSRPRKVSNSAKKSKNKVTEDEAMANKSEKKIAVKAKKIRTVKVPEEKPVITCAVCSRNFKWKSQLDYHVRSHAPEKEFKCSFCDKGLSQMSSLKRHLRVHSGEKPYECEECGKRFPERAKLILHQRKHTGEQPEKKYKCTVCDRGFTLSANMKTHMRTHTGEKPYPCPQCGKAFSRSSDIISHLRSHTGERPYKCSHCQKAFTMISHRNRHEIIHSGEKPFKCDVCGKGFTQPNSVKAHLKVHARRQALLEGDQNDPTQQQREGVSIGAAMQTIEKAGPCESGKEMSQNNGLEQLEMASAPMIGSRDVASTDALQSGRTGQAQFEDLQQGSVHAGDSAQPGVPYRGGANLLQLDTTRVLQAGRVQLNNVEVDTTRVMQGGHVQLNNAEVDGITRQAISLRDGTELTTISAQQLQLRCTNEQFDIVSSQMNSRELLPLACVTQGINENEHDDVHVQLELAQNIGEDQLHVDEREEIAPTLLAL